MANTELDQVVILDKSYPVMPFTATQLLSVAKMLVENEQGNWEIGPFRAQCEAAEIVKEVICPDLPAEIISVSKTGKYIWGIEYKDLTILLKDLMRIWNLRQIKVAKDKGDKDLIKELEQQLKEFDTRIAETAPTAEEMVDSKR